MKTSLTRAACIAAPFLFAGLAPTLGAAGAAPVFRFHHVHLNTVNVRAAIDFYAAHFNAERAHFGDLPAIRAQGKWLLFDEVSSPPPWSVVSSLYHIGWGAPDMMRSAFIAAPDGVELELVESGRN